jgi:hypothetical protein
MRTMGKRFTETSKWMDRWFRTLSPQHKLAWLYVLDNCDAAGVIEIDRELADFQVGSAVDWDAFAAASDGRLIPLDKGKHWVCGFIKYQYGELSEGCKAHNPAFASLTKHGLNGRVAKGYSDPIQRVQEKDKDKDKETDKEKEGGCKGEPPDLTPFANFWSCVPNKIGKAAASSAYKAAVKALRDRGQDDPHGFLLDRMKAFAVTPKAKGEYCPHPATWLNQGRYDDDPATWQQAGRGSPAKAPVNLGASHVYNPNSVTCHEI